MIARQAVGTVAGVHGFRVKVELDPEWKSAVRSSIEGTSTVIAINSYLTFEIGGGETAIGIITDLEARESFDPATSVELTLELVRPRRTATVQLLGTIRQRMDKEPAFDPGITVLPTLDTPANAASKEVLRAVFLEAPRRNKPAAFTGDDFDTGLELGTPAGAPGQRLLASFNDVFSRPLAVVGNTGSGKSSTIAHMVQRALDNRNINRPRFFIIDINGEYGSAFEKRSPRRVPNEIYRDGEVFGIPIWLMNAAEVCEWLSAAEQVQEPVLKSLWSLAKGGAVEAPHVGFVDVREAIVRLSRIEEVVRGPGAWKGRNAHLAWQAFMPFFEELTIDAEARDSGAVIDGYIRARQGDHEAFGMHKRALMVEIGNLRSYLTGLGELEDTTVLESADKPLHFPIRVLYDPTSLFAAARSEEGDNALQQNLRGLQLRLRNRLSDKRWTSFMNYESIDIGSAGEWFGRMGIGRADADDVCVIDCSMLSYEVLPYATGVIGRTILELREHADAGLRYHEPWVLVLEEAHNYVRPRRQNEDRGIGVSREAFERIAKEGRKFGLSLIVASQRPSEISPTVLSQCANFIMHRLQNPEDIEHFRSIVPSQSRRLLEQATILGPGEAIVVGSAFHVPSRVKVHKPNPEPSSQSSVPHLAWQPESQERFRLEAALTNWGIPPIQQEQTGDGATEFAQSAPHVPNR